MRVNSSRYSRTVRDCPWGPASKTWEAIIILPVGRKTKFVNQTVVEVLPGSGQCQLVETQLSTNKRNNTSTVYCTRGGAAKWKTAQLPSNTTEVVDASEKSLRASVTKLALIEMFPARLDRARLRRYDPPSIGYGQLATGFNRAGPETTIKCIGKVVSLWKTL